MGFTKAPETASLNSAAIQSTKWFSLKTFWSLFGEEILPISMFYAEEIKHHLSQWSEVSPFGPVVITHGGTETLLF